MGRVPAMRIVHFLVGRCNPDSANGVDKTVYYLAKHQAVLGHDVAVFSLTTKLPLSIPGVEVRCFAPRRVPLRLPTELLDALIKRQPDVVHLHSVYTPANASLGRWLVGRRVPYVVTPNGGLAPAVLRRRWYLKVPYRILVERPLLNKARFVHAVADGAAIRSFGVSAPIVSAPNGIDLAEVPVGCDPGTLTSRFPVARGKRVFLFLGRLDPVHKGLDLLLGAFNRAPLPNTVLILVGPDWRGGRLTLDRMSRRLGLHNQVVFAGPAYGREKFELLMGADVFVHVSRWEGAPFAVLEAAASCKPCFVSPAADPCGMIARYGAGFLVPPEVGGVADGLRRAWESPPDDLRAMGLRARQMVEEEFRWDKTARKILEAYRVYAGPLRLYA